MKEEYDYFMYIKFKWLAIDLMSWLGTIKTEKKTFTYFKFKNRLEKLEEEINAIKEGIYHKWKINKLSELLKIEGKSRFYHSLIKELNHLYPKYDENEVQNFRKDIGLC